MGITANRIMALARFVLLPIVLIGDYAIASLPLDDSILLVGNAALGYATVVAMLLAFRRRSAPGLALSAGIIVVIVWAAGPSALMPGEAGGGLPRLLAALAGVLCGALPACVREWQRLASGDVHMSLAQLRVLWRRKRRPSSAVRPAASRQRHFFLLSASKAKSGTERIRDDADPLDLGPYPRAAPRDENVRTRTRAKRLSRSVL